MRFICKYDDKTAGYSAEVEKNTQYWTMRTLDHCVIIVDGIFVNEYQKCIGVIYTSAASKTAWTFVI